MTATGYKLLFVPSVRALHKDGTTSHLKTLSQKAFRLSIINHDAACLKMTGLSVWPDILWRYLRGLIRYEFYRTMKEKIGVFNAVKRFYCDE
jgi:hypothetical protein